MIKITFCSLSFRANQLDSGVLLVYSASFQCHSGSFQYIPVPFLFIPSHSGVIPPYSSIFRYYSVPFLCLVMPFIALGWHSGESTRLPPMWPRFNSWDYNHVISRIPKKIKDNRFWSKPWTYMYCKGMQTCDWETPWPPFLQLVRTELYISVKIKYFNLLTRIGSHSRCHTTVLSSICFLQLISIFKCK